MEKKEKKQQMMHRGPTKLRGIDAKPTLLAKCPKQYSTSEGLHAKALNGSMILLKKLSLCSNGSHCAGLITFEGGERAVAATSQSN